MQITENNPSNRHIKGIAITVIVHSLLLLCFMLFSFKTPPPPEPTLEGMLINLGNSDTGNGEIQPLQEGDFAAEELPTNTATQQSTTTTTDPYTPASEATTQGYETQDYETTTAMTEGKIPDPTSNATSTNSMIAATPPSNPSTVTNNSTPQRTANPNALFKAKNHTGTGGNNANENNGATSEGNGQSNGDMGATNGDPGAKNRGNWSTGMGSGGGVELNMNGRKFKQKPIITDNTQETGTIILKIKVDNKGRVLAAEFYSKGSTTSNQGLVQKAIKAVKSSYINEGDLPEQTGYVRIVFRVK